MMDSACWCHDIPECYCPGKGVSVYVLGEWIEPVKRTSSGEVIPNIPKTREQRLVEALKELVDCYTTDEPRNSPRMILANKEAFRLISNI